MSSFIFLRHFSSMKRGCLLSFSEAWVSSFIFFHFFDEAWVSSFITLTEEETTFWIDDQ